VLRKIYSLFGGGTRWSFAKPRPWTAVVGKAEARFARMEWALNQVAQSAAGTGLLVECGVAAGASLAHMMAHSRGNALGYEVVGFDSFEGFPDASEYDSNKFRSDSPEFRVYRKFTQSVVRGNIADALSVPEADLSELTLVKGWIPESFAAFDFSKGIALLHLDVDLYEPYKASLEELWDHMLPGGLVLFDEYDVGRDEEKWPGAKKAIDEFCERGGLEIQRHWTGRAHLQKT